MGLGATKNLTDRLPLFPQSRPKQAREYPIRRQHAKDEQLPQARAGTNFQRGQIAERELRTAAY